MLRHLLKLIWKRKSRNLMLTLEILLAFVLVFAIAAFGARSWQLYQLPLGYQPANVWSVTVKTSRDAPPMKGDAGLRDHFRRTLAGLPQVEDVAFSNFSPFRNATMSSTFRLQPDARAVRVGMMETSDAFFPVLGMQALAGTWYSAADDGLADTPVVINRLFAEQLVSGPDAVRRAVGKVYMSSEHSGTPSRYVVRAVVEDFRQQGEFSTPRPYMLMRFGPDATAHGAQTILLRMKPGTPRAFEAALQAQLKGIRPGWEFAISPLGDLRSAMHQVDMAPLLVLSVVAAFLLLMVAFGLFGVLWQNTTRRIPEIGLRRAVGASAGDIYRQIIAEQFMLSSVAMLAGLALLVQLPLTGALGAGLNWQVFFVAAGLAMLVIYLLSLLCSVYPGWRASRLSPTEALHYD
jgi:putative ABC transport system permease protein